MNGNVLLINLSDRTHRTETISDAVRKKYIGGRGMCGYYLNKYLDLNPIIFFCGPLTGTGYPMTDRCSVAHISPYTGGLFRSDFGGRFGVSLQAAGYDGIIITGKSSENISIIIDNDVSFGDAPYDGYSIVKKGKAADKGIRHAGIICDEMFKPHRGSTGYAMAQKNLLSISVKLPHGEAVKPDNEACEDIERLINASPALTGRLSIKNFGTAALYDLACARNMLPHNFRGAKPDADANAYAMLQGEHKSFSCGHCAVACKKSRNGKPFPDYDDFAMLLAAGVRITDITEVYANCFEMGYDVITLCHQLFEYGGKDVVKDIYGYCGNAELNSIKSILAVKGLEIPAFDPRGAAGVALGYAVSANGADWRGAMAVTHEILRKPVATDRLSLDGKAAINIASENAIAAADSLNVCRYAMFSASLEEYARAYNAVTAYDATPADLATAGAEIIRNERDIISKLGFTNNDDTLPDLFFSGENGIDKISFAAELEKYRRMRGLS